MRQRQDDGMTASKVNGYEVRMVAKTVKYLLLQGYKPDQVRCRIERGSVLRLVVAALTQTCRLKYSFFFSLSPRR